MQLGKGEKKNRQAKRAERSARFARRQMFLYRFNTFVAIFSHNGA